MHKHEFSAGMAPASLIERENRQNDALRTVNGIARQTGKELTVFSSEDGSFGSEPGIYLLDPTILEQGPIKDAHFKFEERMMSGAADSAHAVIAGNLSIDHAGPGRKGSEVTIAAKCFEKRDFSERLARAAREVEVMRDMERRGELGLHPVAVAVTNEAMGSSVVLFTKFNEDLFTLDNNPWGRGPTENNINDATLAAQALGRFNTYGYTHRDSKVKNVASVPGKGVAMIDFETTDAFDIQNPGEAAEAAFTDLEYFIGSLADKGLLKVSRDHNYQDNSAAIIDAVQRICQDGYLSAWEAADPAVQDAVLNVVDEVAQRVVERALGQPVSV